MVVKFVGGGSECAVMHGGAIVQSRLFKDRNSHSECNPGSAERQLCPFCAKIFSRFSPINLDGENGRAGALRSQDCVRNLQHVFPTPNDFRHLTEIVNGIGPGVRASWGVRYLVAAFLLFLSIIIAPWSAFALEQPGEELKRAGLTKRHGEKISMDALVIDEAGQQHKLRDLVVKDRPFLLMPAYYTCPRLCGLVTSGVAAAVREMELKIGVDFSVVTLSFDPLDTPERAAELGKAARESISVPGSATQPSGAWQFLTASAERSRKIMDEVGFEYLPDGATDFAHSAVVVVLTPDGSVSQYFTDVLFEPRDMKLALVEAGEGKIGSLMDHAMLYCFRFDQTKGRYTWAAWGTMRVGAVLTVLFLIGLFVILKRHEKQRSS